MIYGIKQIEKQFPGFEARMTGATLFDCRDIFSDLWGKNIGGASNLVSYITENFPDLVKPPASRAYFIFGRLGDQFREAAYIMPENQPNKDFVYDDVFTKKEELKVGYFDHIYSYYWNPKPESKQVKGERIAHVKESYASAFGNTCLLMNKDGGKVWKDSVLSLTREDDEKSFDNYCMTQSTIHDLIICWFYLNVRNIKQKTSYITKLCGHYYPKAWGREYKVLSLSQTLTEHSPGPDLPPGYHVRGHFQRGHFKRKKTGVYWWNPHWRGDFSKGIVMKDYKAKADPCPPHVPGAIKP